MRGPQWAHDGSKRCGRFAAPPDDGDYEVPVRRGGFAAQPSAAHEACRRGCLAIRSRQPLCCLLTAGFVWMICRPSAMSLRLVPGSAQGAEEARAASRHAALWQPSGRDGRPYRRKRDESTSTSKATRSPPRSCLSGRNVCSWPIVLPGYRSFGYESASHIRAA